jgi:hypothetical protein
VTRKQAGPAGDTITYRELGADGGAGAWRRPVPTALGLAAEDFAHRPVVALDVDGVLNVLGGDRLMREPGLRRYECHIPAACQRPSPFRRGYGREDITVRLTLDPAHTGWIRALQQRADVVWATTWDHLANDLVGPLLGLPGPLPVVDLEDAPFSYLKSGDAMRAKASALRDYAAGRPVVLVDDRPLDEWLTGDALDGRGHAVRTDPENGWTRDGLLAVERFLDWADAAGPGQRYRPERGRRRGGRR